MKVMLAVMLMQAIVMLKRCIALTLAWMWLNARVMTVVAAVRMRVIVMAKMQPLFVRACIVAYASCMDAHISAPVWVADAQVVGLQATCHPV